MLIFDFDGTLIKSRDVVYELWKNILLYLGKKLSKNRFITCFNPDWQTFLKEEFNVEWKKHEKELNTFFKWYRSQIENMPLIHDITDYLRTRKFGVVSSSFYDVIMKKCDENKLKPAFIHTTDTLGVASKLELLKHAVKEQELNPDNCIYVCDMKHDIAAAKKTGMRTIAVLWGFNSRQALEEADYIVRTPSKLVGLLKKLGY